MKYFYKTDLKELEKLAKDVDQFIQAYHLNDEVKYALNLCLDEVLTNIISYGMKEKSTKDARIELELEKNNTHIQAIFRDNGIPYDPLNEKNLHPDINTSIEDRQIGGLGVYFLDQYMDNVEYKYIGDCNILTLIKNI